MRRKDITNAFLKECIGDALLKLMSEKSFANISITEITEMAAVTQMTFYRNFTSKEDVLIYKMGILFDLWIEENPISETTPDYGKLILNYFEMLHANKDMLKILYYARCLHIIQGFLNKILCNYLSDEEISFCRAFYAYGLCGITIEWVKSDFAYSPEDMTKIIMDNLINISSSK